MFTSAELIEALQRRLRRSIRPLPAAAGLPPSWQAWLASVGEHAGPASNARAESLVETLAGRDPPPRPPAELLGGWAAFRALWRQQWEPPLRDERGLRVLSRTASLFLHLLLAVALSWLMHSRFLLAPAADAQRGEHVIEVEFIGTGTPEEDGGGAPPDAIAEEAETGPVDQPESVSAPEPAGPPPAPVAAVEAEEPPAPPEDAPAPAAQPLVVTETPAPDSPFQLPPIPPVEVVPSRVRETGLAPRMRDIELAETRDLVAPQVRPAEEVQPGLAAPELEIVEREVALPRTVVAPPVPAPDAQVPELRQQMRQARLREIPMPPEAEVRAAPGADAAADAAAQVEVAGDEVARPQPGEVGAGPAQAQREGGWTTPERADDWGSALRDRPGGQQGTSSLFNPDGSPRLPPGSGRVGGGLPPGTITEDYERIDRMGTWLRRPPTDYEPTSFDRFWVPHESLLQEWVRRSVRTVLIPIPGTGKSIRCDVVTLAVAGGCSIIDPDLQDDPAGARPPPDIPFRPDLHEDQDGLSDELRDDS